MLNGSAGAGLLDTYQAERLPVARATSERASARSAEHSHPGYVPPPTMGGGPGSGVLTTAMGYRYTEGALVGARPDLPVIPESLRMTGDTGTRAPHMWVTRDGARISTLDLYERSFVLLSGAGTPWRAAAQRVAGQLPIGLEAYTIGSGPGADLLEESASWTEVHGTGAEGAVLVRPDGFVAWRSEGAVADPAGTLREVLSTVLHRA